MPVHNSLYYLNLARTEDFIPWDGGVTTTTYNITYNTSGTYGKVGSIVPIFNGTSSYVKLVLSENSYTALQNTEEICFGAWFYLGVVNTTQVLFHSGDSLTSGLVLAAINTSLRCVVGTYDSNYDDINCNLTVGWHHIFINCSTSQRTVYVDGQVVNEANKTYSFTSLGNTQYLGALKGTSNFFKGRVQTVYFAAHTVSRKTIICLAEAPTFIVPLYDANTGYGLSDSSGNSRDPQAVGSFTLDTSSPRYTSALVFSGSSSKYIEMGGYVAYLQTGYTLSIRFKTTRSDTAQVLLDNAKYQNYGCRILIGTNNCIRVAHGYGTANYTLDGSEIETNRWYMLTATWDGSKLKLYLDGVLDTEMDAPETFVANPNYQKLTVGKTSYSYTNNNYQYAYPFYGSICDARVYCTALSAQKIYELYSIPIQIDNKGCIWGFQLVQSQDQTSFTSKGVVATGTFNTSTQDNQQLSVSQTEITATYFEPI